MKSITNIDMEVFGLRVAIREHAKREFPKEACGLVVRTPNLTYRACRNLNPDGMHFVLDPYDFAQAEDDGVIVAMVHTHPNMPPFPSPADKAACAMTKLPWLIVGYPSCAEFWLDPSQCAQEVPYLEREYFYGAQDCYTLVQDWYRRELKIVLPRLEYADEWEWWKKGKDFFTREEFEKFGFQCFTDLSKLERHDIIVMKIKAPVNNHMAIYDGDSQIVHHLLDHLSTREVYRDFFQNSTSFVARFMGDTKTVEDCKLRFGSGVTFR